MTLDELDKLAAEKVMGWMDCYGVWSTSDIDHLPGIAVHRWQPTQNISQAWECLAKLDRTDVAIQRKGNAWLVVFIQADILALSETVQEAIVLACLRAKGVKV